MSKYDPLWRYFENRDEAEIVLLFDDIRGILGFPLDHSFLNFKKELEAFHYRVKKNQLERKVGGIRKDRRRLARQARQDRAFQFSEAAVLYAGADFVDHIDHEMFVMDRRQSGA